jgi:hypothetical protein
MCRWYCTSSGAATTLECLHCGTKYCGACLHGEAGKMESLIKCAKCGKKPRVQDAAHRGSWQSVSSEPEHVLNPDASTLGLRANIPAAKPVSPRAKIREEPAEIKENVTEEEITARLTTIYQYYCAYAPQALSLDNQKWAKAVTDMGLIDNKKLTKTDIDLIFTKIKAKGQRRIEFDGFVHGMREVAERLYPASTGVKSPLAALVATDLVTAAGGLAASGGAAEEKKGNLSVKELGDYLPDAHKPSVFDKLTDSSQYTGTHKHRFDDHGHGKGIAGRSAPPK